MDDPRLNNPFIDRKVKPKKKKVPIEIRRENGRKNAQRHREKHPNPKQDPKKNSETVVNFKKRNIRYKILHSKIGNAYKDKQVGKTKTCNRCGKEFGLFFFERLKDPKKSKKVRRPYCYKCRKELNHEYYEKTKEKRKEKNAAYYAANKERLKQKMKENYARRKYGHLTEEDIPEKIRQNATFLTSVKKRKEER